MESAGKKNKEKENNKGKKKKKNQRAAERKSEVLTLALQNRHLLVKIYGVRSFDPAGNTVIFKSSDITDNIKIWLWRIGKY